MKSLAISLLLALLTGYCSAQIPISIEYPLAKNHPSIKSDSVLDDSLEIIFCDGFYSDTVQFFLNKKKLFDQVLKSQFSTGLAANFAVRKGKKNKIYLVINGKKTESVLLPIKYNRILVYYIDKKILISIRYGILVFE